MRNLGFFWTNPRTTKIHSKFASRSQLFAILTDFAAPLGVPEPAQTIKKPKNSEAKKSLKNRLPSEPPKMSFDYL